MREPPGRIAAALTSGVRHRIAAPSSTRRAARSAGVPLDTYGPSGHGSACEKNGRPSATVSAKLIESSIGVGLAPAEHDVER